MQFADARGISIAYDFVGDRDPTIVVVPQWFLSSRSMRSSALVRTLAQKHRVLLYDRRGTGASDKPGPPYSVGRDARDLGGLVDHADLDGFVLLGHGVRGSLVALNYAGHFPGHVRAVICIGGTPRWARGPEWPYGISDETWAEAFGALESGAPPPVASIALEQDWADVGAEAARDILARTRDEDIRGFLPKVVAPTLVVHLKGDTLVPFEAARWLADSLPNGVLEEFDAPREIPMRAHEEMAAHLEEFIAGT